MSRMGRKRTLPLLLLAGALWGCAEQPLQPGMQQATPTPESTDARARARAHTELASGYYEIGSLGVALEELGEALKSDSNYAPAYNMLGLVYMELKEDAAAQQNFERALRINPLDADVNHNYGSFLCQRKREQEAIRYFLAAIKNPLYNQPDKSYVNAGICIRRTGDAAAAEDYFQKALRLRPNQPQALYQMAELSFAKGRYVEAKSYLTRFMQVATPSAEALWMGVRIERRLGDREAEASYGLQLRRRFPDSQEAGIFQSGRYE